MAPTADRDEQAEDGNKPPQGSRSGRRSGSESDGRAQEMWRLRVEEGLTLRSIGERFGLSPERVRQVLNRHARQAAAKGKPRISMRAMSRKATEVRQARELALAEARASEVLAAWREAQELWQIARALGLRWTSVSQVIQARASDADRAARRASARRRSRADA
jgi:transcriptional regulator with XRE-family HTH domain